MEYKEKLFEIIAGLSVVSKKNIELEDEFAHIGIDSLKIVELIVKIEDEFNIKFEDSELNPVKLLFVKNIVNLTEKYVLAGVE